MAHRIVTLPGDGIGPEILAPTLELLGTALTDETLAACRQADAVLLAAVGGPKWDTTDPNAPRPEQGLLGLRKGMVVSHFGPVRPSPALVGASPLREERI